MSETSVIEIGLAFLGILFSVIGVLLSQKDTKQGEEIQELKASNKENEAKIVALDKELAKNYHAKPEIKEMFDGFKKYLDEKFFDLKQSIDGKDK